MDKITEGTSAVRAARDVRVVFSRLRRRLKEMYDTEGLSPSQTAVLSRLDKTGPASASALAAAEGVRPQSMAATLAALDQRDLIDRQPDPHDGRRQVISVSEAGLAYINDRRQASEEWLARSLQSQLTEQERQTIITACALLETLIQQ
ncbi:MarR family winged helix-turn-helix transcriptional regulator [Fodinicola feengrottensis]|uniref:MarR family transcriptional regulator n=1 Tax=Fodinicola feengrottensis TaxID=435914 RepID=A0ABN2GHL8_9ACTN|nr:MarR family transcriptional regulator [Fodinicola feengrottensis]